MTAPRTDAHALHDLLQQARDSDQPNLQSAWAEVLRCEVNSTDFARRHSEAVRLLAQTLGQVDALGNEALRERNLRYANAWWQMLVSPNHPWNQQKIQQQIMNQAHLDQLGNLAEIIGARTGEERDVPNEHLDHLRRECEQWVADLDVFTEIPSGLRTGLQHDLRHVVWLIENAHLFGAGRVQASAEQVVGGLSIASHYISEGHRDRWKRRTTAFIAGVVLLATGIDATNHVLEGGRDLVENVMEISASVTDGPDDSAQ